MKITYFPYSLILNYSILKALVTYTSAYHFTKVNRQLRITNHLYTHFRLLKDKLCSLYVLILNLLSWRPLGPYPPGAHFTHSSYYALAFNIYGSLLVPVPLSIRISDFRYMVGKTESGLAAARL